MRKSQSLIKRDVGGALSFNVSRLVAGIKSKDVEAKILYMNDCKWRLLYDFLQFPSITL